MNGPLGPAGAGPRWCTLVGSARRRTDRGKDIVATTEDWDLDQSVPAPDAKVLITGTGRAGTTLLVQVLTDLGLDTGVDPDAAIDPRAAAGLELPATGAGSPRIVKNPRLSRTLGRLLDEGRIRVEHVIVPIRDLEVATASRVRLTRYGSNLRTWGGLTGTTYATHQRSALARAEYELLYTIARYELPHTFLAFPRFAHDAEYLSRSLGFLDPSLTTEQWQRALAGRVRPELIHESPLSRREQVMTRGGTAYQHLVARPARALHRVITERRGPGVGGSR